MITTERLLVRHYQPGDRDAFIVLQCDATVREYMNGPMNEEDAGELFDSLFVMQERRYAWGIFDGESQKYCGHVFFVPRGGRWEIGFMLAREVWGRGLATEACTAVLAHFRNAEPDAQIFATADVPNTGSHAVLYKLGFERGREAADEHGPYYEFVIASASDAV